ncbi:MAG: transposase [Accumulibacter sp.]|uniref:transposase n=1 Tax=Accumulibacter sp. TaxID=2053492 RepID=UPI00331546C8
MGEPPRPGAKSEKTRYGAQQARRRRGGSRLARGEQTCSLHLTWSHRLKTKAGRALYALRKQTVEPVFGIIKSVMGFRQFSLRGLKKVTGEWTLVCLAWNLKRMANLRPQ